MVLHICGLALVHGSFVSMYHRHLKDGYSFNASLPDWESGIDHQHFEHWDNETLVYDAWVQLGGHLQVIFMLYPTVSQILLTDMASPYKAGMISGATLVFAGLVIKTFGRVCGRRSADSDYTDIEQKPRDTKLYDLVMSHQHSCIILSMTASIMAILFFPTSGEATCTPPTTKGQIQADHHGKAVICLFVSSVLGALGSAVAVCTRPPVENRLDEDDLVTQPSGVADAELCAHCIQTVMGTCGAATLMIILLEVLGACVFTIFSTDLLHEAQCHTIGGPGELPCGNVTGSSNCTAADYAALAQRAPTIVDCEVHALTLLLLGLWSRVYIEAFTLLEFDEMAAFGAAFVWCGVVLVYTGTGA